MISNDLYPFGRLFFQFANELFKLVGLDIGSPYL